MTKQGRAASSTVLGSSVVEQDTISLLILSFWKWFYDCLPFHRKTQFDGSYSEYKLEASESQVEISKGCACSISTDRFTGPDSSLEARSK